MYRKEVVDSIFNIFFFKIVCNFHRNQQDDEKVNNFGSGSNNHGKEHENYRGKT